MFVFPLLCLYVRDLAPQSNSLQGEVSQSCTVLYPTAQLGLHLPPDRLMQSTSTVPDTLNRACVSPSLARNSPLTLPGHELFQQRYWGPSWADCKFSSVANHGCKASTERNKDKGSARESCFQPPEGDRPQGARSPGCPKVICGWSHSEPPNHAWPYPVSHLFFHNLC